MNMASLTPDSQVSRKNSFKLDQRRIIKIINNDRSRHDSSFQTSRIVSKKNSFSALEEKVINLEHRMKNLHSHHSFKNHPLQQKQPNTKQELQHSPQLNSNKLITFLSSEKKRSNSKETRPLQDQLFYSASQKEVFCSPKSIDFKMGLDKFIPEETFVQKLQKSLLTHKQQSHPDKNYVLHNLINKQNESIKCSFQLKSGENYDEIKSKTEQFRDIKLSNEKETAFYLQQIKSFCNQNSQCFDFFKCNDLIVIKYLSFLLYQQLDSISGTHRNELKTQKDHYESLQDNLKKDFSKVKLQLQEVEQSSGTYQQIKKIVEETSIILVEVIESMKKVYGQTIGGSQQKISLLQVQNLNDQIQKLKNHLSTTNPIAESKSGYSQQIFSLLVTECQSIDSPKCPLSGDRSKLSSFDVSSRVLQSVLQQQVTSKNRQQLEIEQLPKKFEMLDKGLESQFKSISNQPSYMLQVMRSRQYERQKQQLAHLNKKNRRQDENEEKVKTIELLKMENENLKFLLENQQKELLRVNDKTTEINLIFEKLTKHNKLLKEENDEYQMQSEGLRKEILQQQLYLEQERLLNAERQDEIMQLQDQVKSMKLSQIDLQIWIQKEQDRLEYEMSGKKNSPDQLVNEIVRLNGKLKEQQNYFNFLYQEAQNLGQAGLLVVEICLTQAKEVLPKSLAILQNEFQSKKQQIQQKLVSLETFENQYRTQFRESKNQDFNGAIDLTFQVPQQKSCISKSFTEQFDKSYIKKTSGGITQREDSCQYLFSAYDQSHQPSSEAQDYLCMLLAQCSCIEKIIIQE